MSTVCSIVSVERRSSMERFRHRYLPDEVRCFTVEIGKPAFSTALHVEAYATDLEKVCEKRRAEFLSGRSCAHAALMSLDHRFHQISRIAPKADRSPEWPDGVIGSISHSSRRALSAVCEARHLRGIGIDVETLLTSKECSEVEALVMTSDEARCLESLPWQERVTTVFSAKESLYKALYPLTGVFLEFSDVVVRWGNSTRLVLEVLPSLPRESRTLYEVFCTRLASDVVTWCALR